MDGERLGLVNFVHVARQENSQAHNVIGKSNEYVSNRRQIMPYIFYVAVAISFMRKCGFISSSHQMA